MTRVHAWHASCDIYLAPGVAGAPSAAGLEQGLASTRRGSAGAECRGTFGPFFMSAIPGSMPALDVVGGCASVDGALQGWPTPREVRNRGDPWVPRGASTWSGLPRVVSQSDATRHSRPTVRPR